MPMVIDASTACSWFLPDEEDDVARIAIERLDWDEGHAPWLWWFEVRNALVVSERRGRIDRAASGRFLERIQWLRIHLDSKPDEDHILSLARAHGLSFYDAAYIELATRSGLPLATIDRRMAEAALATGVPLVGPAGTSS